MAIGFAAASVALPRLERRPAAKIDLGQYGLNSNRLTMASEIAR
jgi:hypothetical protein